jgi:Domain of unknown function (DUF4340)
MLEMQKRGLILLVAATLVLMVLAVVAIATGDRGVTRAAPGERALPALAAKLGEVGSVAIKRNTLSLTFVRDGDNWLVAEKGNYPAAAGKVRQIVLAMADAMLVEPKTQKAEFYPRLDVEDPGSGKSTLVTLKDKSGAALAELIIGKRRYDRLGTGTDGVYVRKPGDAQAWLARGSLEFSDQLSSWLDRRILDIPEKRIAKVTLTQPDGTKLVITRAKPEDKFTVEDAPADAKFKSETTTSEPAMALESLDLDDVKTAAEMPVPDKDVVTASLTTFDGLTVDVRLLDKDDKHWAALSASGSGAAEAEAKAINDKAQQWTYAIPLYKATQLKMKLSDMLEPPKAS